MATKTRSLLVAAVLLPACAHSTSPNLSSTARDTAAMIPTTSTDQAVPQLSAEEVGKRFLRLIAGLGSREDLSPQRIQDAIGLPIVKATHGDDLFGFVGNLSDGNGWQYSLSFYPKSPSNKKGVSLDFILGDERFPDMSGVCALAFVDYHDALKKMGYVDYPKYGEFGDLRAWIYRKNDIEISIIPEVKQIEAENRVTRTCVRSIGTLN